jgi:hypothetical protein
MKHQIRGKNGNAVIIRNKWSAFIKYVHLPAVAETYGCGLLAKDSFNNR